MDHPDGTAVPTVIQVVVGHLVVVHLVVWLFGRERPSDALLLEDVTQSIHWQNPCDK